MPAKNAESQEIKMRRKYDDSIIPKGIIMTKNILQ